MRTLAEIAIGGLAITVMREFAPYSWRSFVAVLLGLALFDLARLVGGK